MSIIPLRKKGLLVEALGSQTPEPPRALKSLARIVDGDLCHRCGSCVGICPTSVLSVSEEGYPVVENLSSCTDCDLCVKVCPGDEFSVPSMAKQLFDHVPEISDMHGHFKESFITYAADPYIREGSTSGGAITGLLVSLLENKEIDGAILVASDAETLWKGKPIIARTKEEILSTMKSKYAIAPTNAMLEKVIETEGRYALVGLPCQIHGYLKAARLNRKIKERIVLSIGLFCHAAVEHDPMHSIWADIDPEIKKNASRFVSRIGKHPGTPHLEMKDGSYHPVYFPKAKTYRPSSMEILNILYRLYTPSRCMTCYDSTSEFADIAVGDPWMAPPNESVNFYDGYSFVLGRTDRGLAALKKEHERGSLISIPLTPEHARSSNVMMGHEKRGRAFRIIETRRRQGLPVPEYELKIPKASGKEFVLTEINIFTHIFCFLNCDKIKIAILKLSLSSIGYAALRLNNLRRNFRTWRRDFKYKLKNR
jgi:coenzyme F420 hydrogenase subunit beta